MGANGDHNMRDDAVCGLVWAMLGLLETKLRGLVGLFGD